MRKHFAKARAIWPTGVCFDNIIGKQAYCGISLANPNYTGKRLQAILLFIVENFKNPLVITSGYLYRHNYQLVSSTEKEAIKKAFSDELNYLDKELYPSIKMLKLENQIQIQTWYSICNTLGFEEMDLELKNFYEEEQLFKSNIQDIAASFVSSKLAQGLILSTSIENAIEHSIDFLLEEASVFNFLISQGYEVDVYPGKHVSALNNINQKYKNPPTNLKKRIVVELSIHRVGKKNKVINVEDCEIA